MNYFWAGCVWWAQNQFASLNKLVEHLFVDQEVGGSIPPNRTNLFNDLA
jgi:hypothetical protein